MNDDYYENAYYADNVLKVRNLAQKAIWLGELCGQISDGKWENARPFGHYKCWCNASIEISPEHVGKNFYSQKENYDLTSSDLWSIECILTRTLQLVNACLAFPDRADEFIEKHWRLGEIIELDKIPQNYTKRDLMTDLRDLKNIMKVYSH